MKRQFTGGPVRVRAGTCGGGGGWPRRVTRPGRAPAYNRTMTSPRPPREDLAAAMAARRELGPDYDEAFIEAVADRIRETLDARPAPPPRRRTAAERGHGGRDHSLAMAVLSLPAAIPLSAIAAGNAGVTGLFLAFAGIVLVNVTYTFRPRR
ncbi:hypothetical protein FHX41_3217 [Actinomadura hallensis]|uniref:DUF3040 family protein n=2 Tax=Actinomadura hallensis TaxID=337895 RepID=A0A543IG11_9ACTN|nr:hypothetical protein FHX41_3217 [Actinomadura hallensis]